MSTMVVFSVKKKVCLSLVNVLETHTISLGRKLEKGGIYSAFACKVT